MKGQKLFFWKKKIKIIIKHKYIRKNIINLPSAEFVQRVVKVKTFMIRYYNLRLCDKKIGVEVYSNMASIFQQKILVFWILLLDYTFCMYVFCCLIHLYFPLNRLSTVSAANTVIIIFCLPIKWHLSFHVNWDNLHKMLNKLVKEWPLRAMDTQRNENNWSVQVFWSILTRHLSESRFFFFFFFFFFFVAVVFAFFLLAWRFTQKK